MIKFSRTPAQKLKIFQSVIILKCIDDVYTCGQSLNADAKRDAVSKRFEVEIKDFFSKSGNYSKWTEYKKNEYTIELAWENFVWERVGKQQTCFFVMHAGKRPIVVNEKPILLEFGKA